MRGKGIAMKRVLTKVRCVPRFGYDYANVRHIAVELPDTPDPQILRLALERWFSEHGVEDAVFDVQYADDGLLAIVNDEAYQSPWGEPIF